MTQPTTRHLGCWYHPKPTLLTVSGRVGLFTGYLSHLIVLTRFPSWGASAALTVGTVAFVAVFGWKRNGRTLAQHLSTRKAFTKRLRAGEQTYYSGGTAGPVDDVNAGGSQHE